MLFATVHLAAQERYIDSIYAVEEVNTQTYAVKEGGELILVIYEPKGDEMAERPVFLFMHGGGFSGGSPGNLGEVELAKVAASKGYVAIQMSYRLTRRGQSFGCDYEARGKIETFQKAAEDFMDAVRYIYDQRRELRIDPEKIIVGGSSAGAEAVLNAVYNPELMFPDNSNRSEFNFAGVFSLAGAVVDARYINAKNAVPGAFFHGTNDYLVPYATAPHHFCSSNQPGYLILDGSKTIVEKLDELDTSYLLMTYEGAGHEISGVPFDELDRVFQFFKEVSLDQEKRQVKITR